MSDCGYYVIVTVSKGCEPVNQLWVSRMDTFSPPTTKMEFDVVVDNFDAEYDVSFIYNMFLIF